jgi:hypothetical protein
MAASALLVACGGEKDEPRWTRADWSVANAATAARFAPLVRLAKHESLLPMDATRFIERSPLKFDHDRCFDPEPVAESVEPRRLGQGGYTHQDAERPTPTRRGTPRCRVHTGAAHRTNGDPSGFFLDPPVETQRGEGTAAPVYWEPHKDQGRTAYVYWFFYGSNDLLLGNKHEGDWERIAVRLDGDEPVAVTFFGHGGDPCTVPWDESERSDGHPVVYSARGSHASYPITGVRRVNKIWFDRPSFGSEWRTWLNARRVDREPWWGYQGWWGQQNGKGFSGPIGPHPQRYLKEVFTDKPCALERARLPSGFAGEWETREPVAQTPETPGYQMRVVLGNDQSRV